MTRQTYVILPMLLYFSSILAAQQMSETARLSGKQLYQQLCAVCHGIDLDGKGPLAHAVFPAPADLNEHVGEHSFMGIMHPIMHGKGAMPAWQDVLTHDEAFSITEYLQQRTRQTAQ